MNQPFEHAFDNWVVENWNSPGAAEYVQDFQEAPPCPEPWRSLLIAVCGAAGELGEMLEHIKKLVRDGKWDAKEFALEAGDAHHYQVRLRTMFGLGTAATEYANKAKLIDRRNGRLAAQQFLGVCDVAHGTKADSPPQQHSFRANDIKVIMSLPKGCIIIKHIRPDVHNGKSGLRVETFVPENVVFSNPTEPTFVNPMHDEPIERGYN